MFSSRSSGRRREPSLVVGRDPEKSGDWSINARVLWDAVGGEIVTVWSPTLGATHQSSQSLYSVLPCVRYDGLRRNSRTAMGPKGLRGY